MIFILSIGFESLYFTLIPDSVAMTWRVVACILTTVMNEKFD